MMLEPTTLHRLTTVVSTESSPMRIQASVLLLALMAPLCLLPASATADSSTEEHFDDARSLYMAGHWDGAHEAFEVVYERTEADTRVRAAAALEWATLLWEQGNYPQARRLVDEAFDIARDLDLDEATGELLVARGHIKASMGELEAAESTLDICIQLTSELGDDTHQALCRMNRRMVRQLQGKDPGSEEQFETDLQLLGDADSDHSIATSLSKTSELYRDNREFDQAEDLLNQAEEIYQRLGHVPALTRTRLRQAQLMHQQHRFDEARPLIDGLLSSFEDMRNRPMIVHTRALMAEDSIQQGEAAEGIEHYRQALRLAEEIDNPQLSGRVHLALCEINFADSPDHCQAATDTFDDSGMALLDIRARSALARTLQSRGDLEDAQQTYRDAIDRLTSTVDVDDSGYATTHTLQLANLCQVEANLRDDEALSTCRSALSGFDDFDGDQLQRHERLRAATVHAAGRAANQAGEGSAALDLLREAIERYDAIDATVDPVLMADILLRTGVLEAQRSPGNATSTFQRALQLVHDLDADEHPRAPDLVISLRTQMAQHQLAQDDDEEARQTLEELIADADSANDHRQGAWARRAKANLALQDDRRSEAIELLEQAVDLAERAGDDDLATSLNNTLNDLR